ncbi:hypothetical protein [Streptomyces spiramenti]|uniref:Uncharacterized protein n=1 Tax=Streptomyces spiramenti TaxID=2720606 RepID=A0ABX1AUE6_9ACTN|nr:hypothetical protein [Streptomyces spiramenti]NJP69246.1 hypothetical protein [Streptomyces spiramenti]
MSDFTITGHLNVACPTVGTSVGSVAPTGVAAVPGAHGCFVPASTPVVAVRERGTALAVAAVVADERTAAGYGFTATGAGAEADAQLFGQQKSQLHPMWALRGLDPWTDPT